jgi:flagellar biogenesis protein FliO
MKSGDIVSGLSLEKREGAEHGVLQTDPWRRLRVLWRSLLRIGRRAPRRLRLCESLPLGERRFVAVVEFEQTRFLLGGTSASLILLARLENTASEGPDAESGDSVSSKECR